MLGRAPAAIPANAWLGVLHRRSRLRSRPIEITIDPAFVLTADEMLRPSPSYVIRLLATATLAILMPVASYAACMNKFVSRTDGNKKVVTLLTGSMTFQEAQELAKNLQAKKAVVEWQDDKGKVVASAAEFQAVRPMPVACGDKPSGAVVNVVFLTFTSPAKTMTVKLGEITTVTFEEQAK